MGKKWTFLLWWILAAAAGGMDGNFDLTHLPCPLGKVTPRVAALEVRALFRGEVLPHSLQIFDLLEYPGRIALVAPQELPHLIRRSHELEGRAKAMNTMAFLKVANEMTLLRLALSHRMDSLPVDKRRELVEQNLENDALVDVLAGLDEATLNDQEKQMYAHERFGQEKVWLGRGHTFYGSSYRSFESYDKALKIPRGGKVVDLGAGPLLAAPYYATRRPDVTLVGYEKIKPRVEAGNRVAERLGMGEKGRVHEKDLSQPDLDLEEGDGYILMNPFPEYTSKNILQHLRQIAEKNKKPFRILIFEDAYHALEQAQGQDWLKPVDVPEEVTAGATYKFSVFEVKPESLRN